MFVDIDELGLARSRICDSVTAVPLMNDFRAPAGFEHAAEKAHVCVFIGQFVVLQPRRARADKSHPDRIFRTRCAVAHHIAFGSRTECQRQCVDEG